MDTVTHYPLTVRALLVTYGIASYPSSLFSAVTTTVAVQHTSQAQDELDSECPILSFIWTI